MIISVRMISHSPLHYNSQYVLNFNCFDIMHMMLMFLCVYSVYMIDETYVSK